MGTGEDPEVEEALSSLVRRIGPGVIVASGDLTHRGRRKQHERAARFLTSLGAPVLAVPGNHDLPYTFPARFTGPVCTASIPMRLNASHNAGSASPARKLSPVRVTNESG